MQVFKRILLNGKKIAHFAEKILMEGRLDRREKDFIEHNKKVWEHFLPKEDSGEILLELIGMASSIIAFSYLANLLAKMHQGRIVAYLSGCNNLRTKIENRKLVKIFKSFNVSDFAYFKLTHSQLQDVERLFNVIVPRLKSKNDVEDLKVEGVWIGDLLYDSHCRNFSVPTISLEDRRFHESLRNAVRTYVYWRDYLDTHLVRSVIVSHTVYVQSGVITRLAIQKEIPVYQIMATHLYLMNNYNITACNDFLYFPEQFRELSKDEQEISLQLAEERINQRFSGKVGVNMYYSTKSAYGQIKNKKVLIESDKIKILIATHCFFDSPHPFGVNLFPDYYEWLTFLGEISEETDYDWYIKTHPDFIPGNVQIINEFLKKYPKFNLVPAETSHLQLINEGINFALTVLGTIGFEYAALGVPVINASLCNPHIRYNFNIHPQSVEDLRQYLLNLKDIRLNINITEVYEFYYMMYIYNTDNWLFNDYEVFLKDIGGYFKQFDSIGYKYFIGEFTESKHDKLMSSLKYFIESEDYHFNPKHLRK